MSAISKESFLTAAVKQGGLPALRSVAAVINRRIGIRARADAVGFGAADVLALQREARADLAHDAQHLGEVHRVRYRCITLRVNNGDAAIGAAQQACAQNQCA